MDKSASKRLQRPTNPLEAELKKGVVLGVPAEELLGWVRKALEKDQRDQSGTHKNRNKAKMAMDVNSAKDQQQQQPEVVGGSSTSHKKQSSTPLRYASGVEDGRSAGRVQKVGNREEEGTRLFSSEEEKDRRTRVDRTINTSCKNTHATSTSTVNNSSLSSPASASSSLSPSFFIEIDSLKLLVERVRELSCEDNEDDDGKGRGKRRGGGGDDASNTCSDDDDDEYEDGERQQQQYGGSGSNSNNPSPRNENEARDDFAVSRESSSRSLLLFGSRSNSSGNKNSVRGGGRGKKNVGDKSLRLVTFSSPDDEHVNRKEKVGVRIAFGGGTSSSSTASAASPSISSHPPPLTSRSSSRPFSDSSTALPSTAEEASEPALAPPPPTTTTTTTAVRLTNVSSIDSAVKIIHDHLTLQSLKEKGLRALLKTAKKATAKANAEAAALRKIANAHEEEKESLRQELTFAQNRFSEVNQQLERLALETVVSTRFAGNTNTSVLLGGGDTAAERANRFNAEEKRNAALHQSLPRGEETQLLLVAVERALETIVSERRRSHHTNPSVVPLHSDTDERAPASEFTLRPNSCASSLMNINKNGDGCNNNSTKPFGGTPSLEPFDSSFSVSPRPLRVVGKERKWDEKEESGVPTVFTFSRTSSNQRGLIGRAQNMTTNSQNTNNNETSPQHQRPHHFSLSKLRLPNDVQSTRDYGASAGNDGTADLLEASSSSVASALLGTARPTFPSVIPDPFSPQSGGDKERAPLTPPTGSTTHRQGDSLTSGHRPLNSVSNTNNNEINNSNSSNAAHRYGPQHHSSQSSVFGRTRSGLASFSSFPPRNTTHPSTPSAHAVASGGGGGATYAVRSNSNANVTNNNAVLLHDLRKKVAELTKANEKLKSRCDRLSAHNKALSNAAMHHHDQLSQHRTFANRVGLELQETLTSTDETLKKKIKKIEMLETETIPSLKIGQKRLEDQIAFLEEELRAAHAQLYAAEITREAERESAASLIAKLKEEKALLELMIVKKEVAGAAVPSSRRPLDTNVGGETGGGKLAQNAAVVGNTFSSQQKPNSNMSIKQQLKLFLDDGRADDDNEDRTLGFGMAGIRQGREAACKIDKNVKERGNIVYSPTNSESDAVKNRVVLPPITLSKTNTFSSGSSGGGGGVGGCNGDSTTESPSRWEALVADLKNDIKKDQMGIKSRGPPLRRR